MTHRLVVLISGNGSNLQAILDACASGKLPAQVVAVISNRTEAFGLQRARNASVTAIALPHHKALYPNRESYDLALAEQVASFQPDLIVCAGWMRLLSPAFLNRFPHRVINLHPALPGCFPGVGAIERAWQAFQRGEIDHTGVMVHEVDAGVDTGPVIAAREVPIFPDDTLADLEARVHGVEHELIVAAIAQRLAEKPSSGVTPPEAHPQPSSATSPGSSTREGAAGLSFG